MVTCDWWTHIWLNEAMAEYFSYWSWNKVLPEHRANEHFFIIDKNWVLSLDSDPFFSLPVLHTIDSDYDASFGGETYNKGANLMRLIESMMGTEVFYEGMNAYLTKHNYSTATTTEFLTEMTAYGHATQDGLHSSVDLNEVMLGWLTQKTYPYIHVTIDDMLGLAEVRQGRFTSRPDQSGDPHVYKWHIPLTYTIVGAGLGDFNIKATNYLKPEEDSKILGINPTGERWAQGRRVN